MFDVNLMIQIDPQNKPFSSKYDNSIFVMYVFLENEIDGSACGDDDEDCGSSSGSHAKGNPNVRFGKIFLAFYDPSLNHYIGRVCGSIPKHLEGVYCRSWFIGFYH